MKLSIISSQKPHAQEKCEALAAQVKATSPEGADVIVALGGDGFMLEALHKFSHLGKPVYGLNFGTVGFLMNKADTDVSIDLAGRITAAEEQVIHPLLIEATDATGEKHTAWAINEVSILRQDAQAANIQIEIDGRTRMDNLMSDGILLSTPAGSTAYNYSAHGPILPIDANVLALTPLAAFRPRRWRGAVVNNRSKVIFRNLDPIKRPIMVSADSASFENIVCVEAKLDTTIQHRILFDPGHNLEERVLQEQFL